MTYIQWTTSDNKTFFPVGKTVDLLPAGCYSVQESMQGLYLERQDIRNSDILKLPDTNSDKVVNEISKFWESKERFVEHKMPYKRGILLYGPPGSGKTCTLRTVMEDVENRGGLTLEFKHPYMFMEGYKMIRQVHPDRPVIALMEDVDAILERCSESEFLNVLDGVQDLNNVVFVATTNYPEKLGSRIFNRPSRFDKRFKIGMPNDKSRKMYLEHKGVEPEFIDEWVKETEGLSIAHLAELYTAVKVLGEDYSEAIDVIKGMETILHSSLFDKAGVDSSPESVGKMYYEHKNKINKNKVLTESKKSGTKLINESRKQTRHAYKDIDAIADLM